MRTVFIVPQTHDMVSQLFSPSQPKNASDVLVVAVLGIHILTLYLLPSAYRAPIFAAVFLFWRSCYNAGIGFLLHLQSNHWRLVAWAKQTKIFVNPKTGENSHPILHYLLKREMETKIPEDYKFEEAPVEYNTWLVFRRVVDLILMCDFVSYCLYAIACGGRPENEGLFLTTTRWLTGIGLFGFNLWVKLDAHRVVKDYAWYWGDFFYLIDQELTFDGVFEMAPHPMYSIGYAGYYGISLMAASYRVLLISVIAHAAQFAFLIWVENPHIDKTYNAPPPRKRLSETVEGGPSEHDLLSDSQKLNGHAILPVQPSTVHNLLGVQNVDLYRVTDSSVIILQVLIFALTVLTPSDPFIQSLFVTNAVLWRLWYSLGIGYVLNRQSTKKRWTRHFLKYGDTTEEAWRQWKGIYHLSMTLCYASFVAASWKMYSRPVDWKEGLPVLMHVIGTGLIALQIWTAISIYNSLGEFGWFFGDFFFVNQRPKLTYSGIYRYLNNPERVIGLAGVWGAALITGSAAIFFLAILSHILTLAFIQLVERPHMQKLYGQSLRQESGLTKSLKRSLPPQFLEWQGSFDKLLEDTLDSIEDLVDATRPLMASRIDSVIKDTTSLFKHPTRLSISSQPSDLGGFDPADYAITIVNTTTKPGSITSNDNTTFKPLVIPYGDPIRLHWTAPPHHSKKDWIGLYRVTSSSNASPDTTRIASQGRWIATNVDQYGSIIADRGIVSSDAPLASTSTSKATDGANGTEPGSVQGEMEFSGDKLFWETGVFELRYHHAGRHAVMAISPPFEISIDRFDSDDIAESIPGAPEDVNTMVREAIEQAVLKLIWNCFDRDPDIAPGNVEEGWGGLVEREGKFAKRVVYALGLM